MRLLLVVAGLLSTITISYGYKKPVYDDDEERLLRDLLTTYDKKLRPVIHKNETVKTIFALTLNQIIDVIEKYELLKLSLYVRQIWKNPLLSWNASEYGGISQVNLEPDQLWKPDIYLYNNADSSADGSLYGFKAKIKVSHTGLNMWLAPTILTTSCKINVKYFPFDQQSCTLKFGSWTYDAGSVDIDTSPTASIKGYQQNGEWDFISFPCKRNAQFYDCCPHPFTDVTCTLNIRRRTLYYWINLIVPCLLITVLSLLSFIVTTESGERISLVITNLLALTVFMLIVADILPPTSEVVPLISVFITSSIVQVGLSLVATCFVLQCYHTNPDINEMPFWMRHFVCNRLGPFLRVTHVKYQRAKEESGTKAKPGAQLRSIIYGYGARPSEPRNSGVDTSFDISCKVCLQELKAAPVYRSVSRRSSEVLSPPDMYADNLNSHRDRNLYSDQFRGRQEVFFDQYRTNCYHNDSPPDPLNRARLDSTSDPYRARSEYANQGYRGRNDSRAADQLYDRRNNSNTADQPYHGRNDFPAADQPYRGRKDSSNSSDHMPKTACGRDHHDCMSVLGGIIHRQDHLVEGIKRLTDAMEDQEQSSLAREEWVYAAHVIDRFCFYLFLSLLFTSIVVTFNMIPSYDDTSQM